MSTASNQISKWAGTLKPALAVPNEPEAVRGWCPRARAKFRELLAVDGLAALSAPQRPLSRERHGQIVLHRVAIELPNEDPWEAFILEPADVKPSRPAWLCLHGHVPGGASSVTGLLVDSPGGKESLERFEDDYALQLANRGYVTLAFDFPGFAARGDQSLPSTEMILRALILVFDQQTDRRAGGDALEHAGQDFDFVRFAALRGVARLAGPAALEIELDVGLGKRDAGRRAVDDAADRRAMTFAEGGDAE